MIDSSVGVKWVIRNPSVEPNVDVALRILRGIRSHVIEAVVPPHFTAEVLAVVARARPPLVPITFGILQSAKLEVFTDGKTYRRATDLAMGLQHHLFDTLYHATALEAGATLVTADKVYVSKAISKGSIQLLSDFAL